VFWKGRSFPTAMRLGIGLSYSPIYTLTVVFSGLEAISLEAKFAVASYSHKGHTLLERVAHTTWFLDIFCIQLRDS
jgi:hypothetical protein